MADINPGDYAASVVKVLREHFPDLADPTTAEVITEAIERQSRDPHPGFEVIVDDPAAARFRLKTRSDDHRRVRLAYYPVFPPGSNAGNALEAIVNDALQALETGQ